MGTHPAGFTVEHATATGRLRLRHPAMRGNHALAARLAALMRSEAHWLRAEVRARTGSIILHHDPAHARDRVLHRLGELVAQAREGVAPPPAATAPLAPRGAEETPWHSLSGQDIARTLESDGKHGLTAGAAAGRLAREGRNLLPQQARPSPLARLAEQFNSIPVMMLAGSAVVSVVSGGTADAVATVTVIAVNAVLGYVTEGQAEAVIEALTVDDVKRETVTVLRDGIEIEIPAADLVRGDLYRVGPGMQLMADARVIQARRLMVDEAALTGETLPVEKVAEAEIAADAPIGSRPTILHTGTIVTEGRGTAMVVGTGQNTVAARIAQLSREAQRPRAPVEAELDRLGARLAYLSLGACGLLFGVGWMRGYAVAGLLRDAVALAVAAVPEGLPVVATTTMALGLKRMERRGILIRRIDAVESLGALQTMCLDKTGTLTQNRMRVVVAAPGLAEVALTDLTALGPLAEAAALNNDGIYGADGATGSTATEHALLEFAADCGLDITALRMRFTRVGDIARAPDRPWMATTHDTRRNQMIVKGAPDAVLARCTRLRIGDRTRALTGADRAIIGELNETLAARPARLLGFAEGAAAQAEEDITGLTWLGLLGMVDPLRPGAPDFIAALHRAGLETVMITGDQSATAGAIARELNLANGAPVRIVDSPRIADMDPALLSGLARKAHVFARVSADQKLAIVQALQAADRIVAMTGDGVNDAPALKAADIGIAMGASGTDLARDVANVVIRDDELTTLIDAIGQGRTVYRNIRRALEFLVTTNMSEIVVSMVEAVHGPGELETPMELLWINLVTDVLPGLGLALADPDPDAMNRPPRRAGEPIFPPEHIRRMGIDSSVISASALTAHFIGLSRYGPGPETRGMTFLALSLGQLLYTMTCQRGDVRKLTPTKLLENRALDLAVLGSGALAVLPFFVPPLGRLLGVARLGPADTAVAIAAAAFPAASVLFRRGVELDLHPLEEEEAAT